MNYCSIFLGYFIANEYKDFGQTSIPDDRYLTIVGAVSAACAGFRFTWAFMMQKYSYRVVYSIIIIIQIIAVVAINWAVQNRVSYMI